MKTQCSFNIPICNPNKTDLGCLDAALTPPSVSGETQGHRDDAQPPQSPSTRPLTTLTLFLYPQQAVHGNGPIPCPKFVLDNTKRAVVQDEEKRKKMKKKKRNI